MRDLLHGIWNPTHFSLVFVTQLYMYRSPDGSWCGGLGCQCRCMHNIILYADDILLFWVISSSQNYIILQMDVDTVSTWVTSRSYSIDTDTWAHNHWKTYRGQLISMRLPKKQENTLVYSVISFMHGQLLEHCSNCANL